MEYTDVAVPLIYMAAGLQYIYQPTHVHCDLNWASGSESTYSYNRCDFSIYIIILYR